MLPGKKYTPDDYARMAWRRRWYIAIPTVVIASVTLVVAIFLPDRYRSSSTILIVPQRVPEAYVRPTIEADLTERLAVIQQQLLSRTNLERIVQEFDLYPQARRQGAIMQDVIDGMKQDIGVNVPRARGRREEIHEFTVSFTADNPRTAMRVTERLASLFVNENLQDRGNRADLTSDFLKGQLEEAKRRLETQEKLVATFKLQHSGRLPNQVQSNLQLLQGLQSRQQNLTESNNRDRDRLAVLEKMLAELPPVSSSQAAVAAAPARRSGGNDQNAPMTAAQQLETARNELRALQLRLRPEHPDVGRAKRFVAELESKAEAEALQQPLSAVTPAPAPNPAGDRATLVRAEQIRNEMLEVRQRIESQRREYAVVEQQIADFTGRVNAAPALESDLTRLTRDYETLQESYTSLLKKNAESQMAAQMEQRQIGEQFKTVEGARLPERPISPDRLRINMFGIFGGLAVGLGLVAFLEYRDTSFKSDDDVMSTLALPVLAVIPIMTNAGERRHARRRKLLLAASASVTCMLLAAAVMIVFQNRPMFERWLR